MAIDLETLPRQLRYWSGHCLLNAAPSFAISCLYLSYWEKPETVLAMGLAVLSFIILFSLLTSLKSPLSQSNHTLSRAVRAGVKFRMIVSLASLPVYLFPSFISLVPDLWSGLLATWISQQIELIISDPPTMASILDKMAEMDHPTFARVFAVSIIQGLIISLFMFLFSFFAVLVIQRREREKIYAAGDASGYPASD